MNTDDLMAFLAYMTAVCLLLSVGAWWATWMEKRERARFKERALNMAVYKAKRANNWKGILEGRRRSA